ncbi:PREDICTED: formin-like protein 5 [Ficedula albicollis]|uniref:formin-like protein 5 n=1 Tax=Ficedula albicollis TaxID=59894 RepID=UPI00035963A2|nr:PREDICTED: formin-like protein 5 [Ficedula albicollis]
MAAPRWGHGRSRGSRLFSPRPSAQGVPAVLPQSSPQFKGVPAVLPQTLSSGGPGCSPPILPSVQGGPGCSPPDPQLRGSRLFSPNPPLSSRGSRLFSPRPSAQGVPAVLPQSSPQFKGVPAVLPQTLSSGGPGCSPPILPSVQGDPGCSPPDPQLRGSQPSSPQYSPQPRDPGCFPQSLPSERSRPFPILPLSSERSWLFSPRPSVRGDPGHAHPNPPLSSRGSQLTPTPILPKAQSPRLRAILAVFSPEPPPKLRGSRPCPPPLSHPRRVPAVSPTPLSPQEGPGRVSHPSHTPGGSRPCPPRPSHSSALPHPCGPEAEVR